MKLLNLRLFCFLMKVCKAFLSKKGIRALKTYKGSKNFVERAVLSKHIIFRDEP